MKRNTKRIGGIALSVFMLASLALAGLTGSAVAAGDVTVTVQDSSGSTIEGASVTLYDGSDSEVANGTTDTNGQVTFANISDGNYTLEASSSTYPTTSTDVSVSGTAVSKTVTLSAVLEEHDVTIDNSSTDVWVELENATVNNATANATVVYHGVDDGGNQTELSTETLTVDGIVTSELALTDQLRANYSEVHVDIRGVDGTTFEATDAGTYQAVSGGGGVGGLGGLMDITVAGIPVVLIVVLGGGYLWMRE